MKTAKNLCDLLEAGEIDIHQFNRAIRYREGPCPKECPERRVGCKNADTCEKWAAHEAEKKRIYELRKRYGEVASAEARHRAHVFGKGLWR